MKRKYKNLFFNSVTLMLNLSGNVYGILGQNGQNILWAKKIGHYFDLEAPSKNKAVSNILFFKEEKIKKAIPPIAAVSGRKNKPKPLHQYYKKRINRSIFGKIRPSLKLKLIIMI